MSEEGEGLAVCGSTPLVCYDVAMVTGVMVEQLTATSVRVSWDEIPVEGITYRVYYSQTGNRKRQSTEMFMDSTTNSVDIDGLDSNVEYQFQVVAIAVVNGETIEGERSEANDDSMLVVTTDSPRGTFVIYIFDIHYNDYVSTYKVDLRRLSS